MKLGDLLNKLATKNGTQNDQALISLLSNASLADAEVADDFANGLDKALMTIEGAKNSIEVKSHYQATLLKAIDDDLAKVADKLGIKTELDAEKSTYKKLSMAIERSQKLLEDAKAKSGDPNKDAEVKRLTEQIQAIQAEKVKMAADFNTEKTNLLQGHQNEIRDMLMNQYLAGKDYIFEGADTSRNIAIARAVLDGELSKRKAIIVNDGGTLKVKQLDSPELDYLDSGNKVVTYSGLCDQILGEAKLLKTSGEPAKPAAPTITVPKGDGSNQSFDNAIAESLKALE